MRREMDALNVLREPSLTELVYALPALLVPRLTTALVVALHVPAAHPLQTVHSVKPEPFHKTAHFVINVHLERILEKDNVNVHPVGPDLNR